MDAPREEWELFPQGSGLSVKPGCAGRGVFIDRAVTEHDVLLASDKAVWSVPFARIEHAAAEFARLPLETRNSILQHFRFQEYDGPKVSFQRQLHDIDFIFCTHAFGSRISECSLLCTECNLGVES